MNATGGRVVRTGIGVLVGFGCVVASACSVDERAFGSSSVDESMSPIPEAAGSGGAVRRDAAASDPSTASGTPEELGPEVAFVGDSGVAPDPALPEEVLLTLTGSGSGRFGRVVTNEPSAVVCTSPPCTFSLPRGTSIVLHAQTDNVGSGFAGWQHDRCMGQGDCPLTLTKDESVGASYEPANLVFVTSTTVTGDFGGPVQADAICSARAAEQGFEGTFRAWVSTTSADAVNALQGSRGWVRVDNLPVVDSVDSLLRGRMFYPIQTDETGANQSGRIVWSGTSGGTGQLGVSNCNDWTSASAGVFGASGATTLVGMNYGSVGESTCDTSAPIYCFGVGRDVTLSPVPVPGRLAFIADQFFPIGGGIAAADAHCQANAEAGGLTGSYKAILATSSGGAASRFDLSDATAIVRADGMLVSTSARRFFEGPLWLTGINVSPRLYYVTNYSIWSGGTSLSEPGTLENTCSDWTLTEGQATLGFSTRTTPAEFFYNQGRSGACTSSALFLPCLEE